MNCDCSVYSVSQPVCDHRICTSLDWRISTDSRGDVGRRHFYSLMHWRQNPGTPIKSPFFGKLLTCCVVGTFSAIFCLRFFSRSVSDLCIAVCWYIASNEQHSNILVSSCSFMRCWCIGSVLHAPVFSLFTYSRFPADHRIKNVKLTRGRGRTFPQLQKDIHGGLTSAYKLQAAYVCLGADAAAAVLVLAHKHAAASGQQHKNTIK